MDLLKIPLCNPPLVADGVSFMRWSGSALDEGDQASKWFTDFLGKPCRLVRFNAASETRDVDPVYAQGYFVMFSDQYPFMLISQHLNEPVSINRFRPNFLVAGCEPFSEDLWTEFKISQFHFKVPTIDQDTAIVGPEPNATLMKIRSDKVLRPDKKQQGEGQSLVCKESLTEGKAKMVKVGDPIYVINKVSTAAEAAA
ncbi:hypothetical protein GQ457_10G029820 [Hibiscus cannabinus]